jgi:shikimate dehydrogenase
VKRYAVIGHPVAHSLSPAIHTAFAEQTGIALSYSTLEAPPDGFARAAAEFFAAGGAGLNVTVPFKEAAFEWVGERDPYATVAGAVNTIVPVDGGHRGCNTDGLGLRRDLEVNLGVELSGRRILILGAGGAVRGIVGARRGANPAALVVANRTAAKARALAERLEDPRLNAVPLTELAGPFDIIVNGTSAGLTGALPEVPDSILAGTFVYDLVYGDAAAAFLAFAEHAGAAAVSDGLGMLVEQAAEAFALWHGIRPETRAVRARLRGR